MDWRFSTFLLFLFALFFGITWATSQDGMCHSKFVLDVLAQGNKDGALNCFEFWFNRYQTLAGALIALLTAAIAVRPVLSQLREMRRQTNQLEIAAAERRIVDIGTMYELMTQVILKGSSLPIVAKIILDATKPQIQQRAADTMLEDEDKYKAAFEMAISRLRAFYNPNSDEIERGNFIDAGYQLLILSGKATVAIKACKPYDVGGNNIQRAIEHCSDSLMSLQDAYNELTYHQDRFFKPALLEQFALYNRIRELRSSTG